MGGNPCSNRPRQSRRAGGKIMAIKAIYQVVSTFIVVGVQTNASTLTPRFSLFSDFSPAYDAYMHIATTQAEEAGADAIVYQTCIDYRVPISGMQCVEETVIRANNVLWHIALMCYVPGSITACKPFYRLSCSERVRMLNRLRYAPYIRLPDPHADDDD